MALARVLPRGSGLVYRSFGAGDAGAIAAVLRAIASRRGLVLLVGADRKLAAACRADGVHLPERLARNARAIARARPGWIVTAAAHGLPAARRALAAGAQAVVVSPVFPSRSPSAGTPLGPLRLAAIARAAGGPVYALGGVNGRTAARLLTGPAAGLAAVEGLAGG